MPLAPAHARINRLMPRQFTVADALFGFRSSCGPECDGGHEASVHPAASNLCDRPHSRM